MSKALESGKSFADQILAKLPENLRDQAKTVFTAAEASDALTLLGDGVLARSDYSKQLDDLREKQKTLNEDYTNLTAWYDKQKTTLARAAELEAENARLRGRSADDDDDPFAARRRPDPAAVPGITEDVLLKTLEDRERAAARYLNATTKLATEHLQTFGEVLDLDAVTAHAEKTRTPLGAAYQDLFRERLAEKSKAAEDARINKEVETRLAAKLAERQSTPPYPIRGADAAPIDILSLDAAQRPKHDVDSAVAEYERLTAARG